MRKLSAGNKTRFTIFTLIIISITIVLVVILNRVLDFEKEEYIVEKEVVTYDKEYEYVSLKSDAKLQKKWTGKYYLTESESGASYELGDSAVTYNPIKNKLNLYGTFFEVALDGEVTKTNKHLEISNMIDSKIYKIEDRKYLIVAEEISNETGSFSAENYLIVVIDKSGNTLLLNNLIDVKSINAIILKTDTFEFDVANEKLIYEDTIIDLKKIIGSSNEYIEPEKKEDKKEENKEDEDKKENENVLNSTPIVDVGSNAQSSTNLTINVGENAQQNNNNDNNNNANMNDIINVDGTNENVPSTNKNNDTDKNKEVIKSANLRSISPGATHLDVSYLITDPNNEYQVVYLAINSRNYSDNISLDKTKDSYKITGLTPNTEYAISLGYKTMNSDATVDEVTEDVLTVKTLKLQGALSIIKVTEQKIDFNLKIDKNSLYDNAKLYVYINNEEQAEYIQVDTKKAISDDGWTSSIERTDDMIGKITLVLKEVEGINLKTSTQIY